uniref:Uncharacterized protein n=1 Tax=Clastoptera arizonana TaxID=38151 RepID=A0A1B6E8W8_9HEMI
MSHNELICHATGEQRKKLIKDLKSYVDKLENNLPIVSKREPIGKPGGRLLKKYIGCVEKKQKIPRPPNVEKPIITNIQVHESRPTSQYERMKVENTRLVSYRDACPPTPYRMPPPWHIPRTKSQELRGGVMYVGCDCTRKNGLQDDCQRWECGGSPKCVAQNPGPCCIPALSPKPIRGQKPLPDQTYDQYYC